MIHGWLRTPPRGSNKYQPAHDKTYNKTYKTYNKTYKTYNKTYMA